MKRSLVGAILAAMCLLASPNLFACLWDYDTLEMERQRFPDVLELVTGKFLRHSPEYYQWRVKDRTQRIEDGDAGPEVYDDLAVAYDKLGDHEKAIETILTKDKYFPDSYKTYANLGTFYIHSGQLEKGIQEIDRAIEINPDAHFGREVYQKLLVQYVLSKQPDGELKLPLDAGDHSPPSNRGLIPGRDGESEPQEIHGFDEFLTAYHGGELSQTQVQKAVKGVLGMMHFGHYDSPILLEALGDLLTASYSADAKQLAARAYLKASYEVDEEPARLAYRSMAKQALAMQTVRPNSSKQLDFAALEATFQRELAEAQQWYEPVRVDELTWIEAGENPDVHFSHKYYSEPIVSDPVAVRRKSRAAWMLYSILAVASLSVLLAIVLYIRGRRAAPAKQLREKHIV